MISLFQWFTQWQIRTLLRQLADPRPAVRQRGLQRFQTAVEAGQFFLIMRVLGQATTLDWLSSLVNDPQVKRILCEFLVASLDSYFENIRSIAVRAIDRLGWIQAFPDLLLSYAIVREEWDICIRSGGKALDPLFRVLRGKKPAARLAVVGAVGEIFRQSNDPVGNGAYLAKQLQPVMQLDAEQTLYLLEALVFLRQPQLCAVDWNPAMRELVPLLGHWSFAVRKKAAELMVGFYTAPDSTAQTKQMILAERAKIIQPHEDKDLSDDYRRYEQGTGWYHVDTCGHSDHGIGVAFPLA